MTGFPDHFSGQASAYAKFRPRYPAVLFHYLALRAPGTRLAWDCGTGNGQAAVGLANRFAHVVATDPSDAQLANAQRHARVARIQRHDSIVAVREVRHRTKHLFVSCSTRQPMGTQPQRIVTHAWQTSEWRDR